MKISEHSKGVISIILVALLGASMGIWVRTMSNYLSDYEQIAARSSMALLLGVFFYRNHFEFKKIVRLPRNDLLLILIRSLTTVIAIILYTKAIQISKYSSVSFISSIPFVGFLSFIILKEKFSIQKLLFIILSFIGTILVSVKFGEYSFQFGKGEIFMFIASFLYSFAFISRKLLTNFLNDAEISQYGVLGTSLVLFFIVSIVNNNPLWFINIPLQIVPVIIISGMTFLGLGFFTNYGMSKISGSMGNNLKVLEAVFATLIALVVYFEVPSALELIGGAIIILSAILMNSFEKK